MNPAVAARRRRFVLDQLPKSSAGMEIGVHKGDFSALILEVVSPTVLHLVDPWKHEAADAYKDAWYGGQAADGQREMDERYEAVRARFSAAVTSGQVVLHRAPSTDVLPAMPDGSLDWVYIDGNHLYEFVKQDIELSFQKVRVGGFVTGDDYAEGGWWEGGVKRAVDEFVGAPGAELREIRGGQYIFEKTAER
jgi:Methyltransferase domain